MAQGKGGTALGRETHHLGQEKHGGEQEASNVHILREFTLFQRHIGLVYGN